MNEKELVLAAKSGDRAAFNELISGYTDRIYRLAWKLSGNEEDAADIFQETFLKAVDNIDSFRLESSFGTWLYTIAMNVMRACFAKRKRMQLGPIEDYLPDHENGANSKLFDWGDPHDLFENTQLREMIDSFLSRMSPENSTPFVLRYMEDMPVKDIARIMDLSVPAVKSRILRARLALREHLTEKFREKKDG
ncbi:MAG: RNA polymerase sigma factor [Candidatus Krumholzibacteria bacterium]|nr:RNA polymerase sigma factor [Candidatus Krumholzibacteria bacterium]